MSDTPAKTLDISTDSSSTTDSGHDEDEMIWMALYFSPACSISIGFSLTPATGERAANAATREVRAPAAR
jgi:hypothetical protein